MASGIVELIVGRGPTGVSLRALSHLFLSLVFIHIPSLLVCLSISLFIPFAFQLRLHLAWFAMSSIVLIISINKRFFLFV